MSDSLSRQTVIVVVRVWEEYLHQTPPAWRGVVTRVDSGEQCYFGDLSEIGVAIEALCAPPCEPDSTSDR